MKQDDGFERMAQEIVVKFIQDEKKIVLMANIANALRQVSKDAFRKGQLDAEKAIRCEGQDPNGTIWEHADRVQKENKALKKQLGVAVKEVSKISRELGFQDASIGILDKRICKAMELFRRWQKSEWKDFIHEKPSELKVKTDEFLKESK